MANKPNINPENIGAGLGELKSRLLFLLFAIFVYRIGTHIPVPGIDPLQLNQLLDQLEIDQFKVVQKAPRQHSS